MTSLVTKYSVLWIIVVMITILMMHCEVVNLCERQPRSEDKRFFAEAAYVMRQGVLQQKLHVITTTFLNSH
jgi:hypothetical protein